MKFSYAFFSSTLDTDVTVEVDGDIYSGHILEMDYCSVSYMGIDVTTKMQALFGHDPYPSIRQEIFTRAREAYSDSY